MKAKIFITISILLLISCGEDVFKIGDPIHGDVSFILNGQKYSSSFNWSISILHNPNPQLNDVSTLIIIDTLGFNFSHMYIFKNRSICGIVITDEYKDPLFNFNSVHDENTNCYQPYWMGERDLEIETLALFKIINGSLETKQKNCITNCGKDYISGNTVCYKYCDLEGEFSFEAENGRGSRISVSDGNFIAYSQLVPR